MVTSPSKAAQIEEAERRRSAGMRAMIFPAEERALAESIEVEPLLEPDRSRDLIETPVERAHDEHRSAAVDAMRRERMKGRGLT